MKTCIIIVHSNIRSIGWTVLHSFPCKVSIGALSSFCSQHPQTKTSRWTFKPPAGLVKLNRIFFHAGEFLTGFYKLSWDLSLVCLRVFGSLVSEHTIFIGSVLICSGFALQLFYMNVESDCFVECWGSLSL